MNNEEKNFSPQESLLLIRSMIATTRHSFSDSSPYFLVWGWAVLLACIGQYILIMVNYPDNAISWSIAIPAAMAIFFIMLAKKKRKEKVRTFVGDASGYLWTALGFCFMAFPFIFSKIGWQYCLPFYILLYGVGTFVSGKLISFKPLVYGGASCLLLAIITPYLPYEQQLLVASIAILVSYIIPGHMLRAHYKKTQTS